jgi:hypothetical protein
VWIATWTVVCLCAGFRKTASRGLFSIAINSGQCFPAIVCFSLATPYFLAALLALCVNAVYALVYLASRAEDRPRRRAYCFFAAAGFEGALVLRALQESWLSAAALDLGVVAIFALVASFGWRMPSPKSSWRNAVASVVVAILLASWMAFTGRVPPMRKSYERRASAAAPQPDPNRPFETISAAGGQMSGVILWPEVSDTTTLVAPLPVWTSLARGALAQDVSIPFHGEYWLFEPPYHRPPPTAVVRKGTPVKLSFHTVDNNPLFMEAHQKLPVPVSIACCRAIAMELRNEDRHGGILLLELILVNGAQKVSLGTLPVTGSRLLYSMPKGAPFAEFDEFGIVYHREPMPIGESAKLAIDRFVLVR